MVIHISDSGNALLGKIASVAFENNVVLSLDDSRKPFEDVLEQNSIAVYERNLGKAVASNSASIYSFPSLIA